MQGWLVVSGASATMLSAFWLACRQAILRQRRRRTVSATTVRAVASAAMEADRRGHRPLSLAHLALGLIAEPAIATELERRGLSLRRLYVDLEACLPPTTASRPKADVPNGVDPSVDALLRRSGASAPAGEVLRALFSSEESAAKVFALDGITAEGWRVAGQGRRYEAKEAPAVAGPYRSPPTATASTDVVFWNDARTTQEFVEHVLGEVFGLEAPAPRRLTLAIGDDGFAVVGTFEGAEATRLARRATELARAHHFPLIIGVEDTGRVHAMTRFQRWRRRRAAGVAPKSDAFSSP